MELVQMRPMKDCSTDSAISMELSASEMGLSISKTNLNNC